jgi:hypothetical protein
MLSNCCKLEFSETDNDVVEVLAVKLVHCVVINFYFIFLTGGNTFITLINKCVVF